MSIVSNEGIEFDHENGIVALTRKKWWTEVLVMD
jgi:hypothetical protein